MTIKRKPRKLELSAADEMLLQLVAVAALGSLNCRVLLSQRTGISTDELARLYQVSLDALEAKADRRLLPALSDAWRWLKQIS